MAKLKGTGIKPAKKAVLRRRMERVKAVFIVATVLICVLLLITGIAGLIGRAGVIKQYGGAEKMATLSQAELQYPYFRYVNEFISSAPGPSFIWTLIWTIPMILMVKTCQLHFGIVATAWFSFGIFLELVFMLVCGILYFRWRKIVTAKPERKKPNVDLVEKMNQQAQEEQKKLEREAKDAERRAKEEDWERRRQEIALQKTQERVKSKTGGRRRTTR